MISTNTSRTNKIDVMQTLSSFFQKAGGSQQQECSASINQLSLSRIPKYLRHLTLALTLLAPLALVEVSYAAGLVFSDGFEDGTTNKWQSEPPRQKCPVVTSALDGGPGPHSGARMMQCNWNGGSFDGVVLNNWSYTNEFLWRFWVRLDSDVDNKDGAKLFRFGFPHYDLLFQRDFDDQSFHWSWFIDGGSTQTMNCWDREKNFLDDHQWHKMEFYIKHDTNNSNGVVASWLDDHLIDWDCGNPRTNLNNFSGQPYFPLNVMSNWSMNPGWEHDSNNHIYWDDMEIFSDTGTGATGSMADGTISSSSGSQTVPNPPSNVQTTPN